LHKFALGKAIETTFESNLALEITFQSDSKIKLVNAQKSLLVVHLKMF